MFAGDDQKMSAIGNAVKLALSSRRAEFETEMHGIEGQANERGGGVALLSSGTFVGQFVDAIEAELRYRTQIASKALGRAVDSQKLNLRQATVEQVEESIRKVWSEGTEDLRDWYQQRVQHANEAIAEERPFEPLSNQALQGVFVDIENRALAPGFWGQNKDQILLLIIGAIIGTALTILTQWLLQLLFPGNGSN